MNGIWFSRSSVPQVDHSFALRIIAFDNEDNPAGRMPMWTTDLQGWKFPSVQVDKRTDVIAVFRIVRMEQDGNIPIIWKRLSSKKSPTIKFGKKETLKSFG